MLAACAVFWVAALGGGGGLCLRRLSAQGLAFDFTTLPFANEEVRTPCSQSDGRLVFACTHLQFWALRRWWVTAVSLVVPLSNGGGWCLRRLRVLLVPFGFTALIFADMEAGASRFLVFK
jgi:hypothetical protein